MYIVCGINRRLTNVGLAHAGSHQQQEKANDHSSQFHALLWKYNIMHMIVCILA